MKRLYFLLFIIIYIHQNELLAQCTIAFSNYTNTCNQVTFNANGNNGVAPYTYYIAGAGATIDSVSGQATITATGTFTVTAIDAVSCVATDTLSVSSIDSFHIEMNNVTNLYCYLFCTGFGNTIVLGNGYTLPITYSISVGGNINPQTGYANNLCAGTYTVTATDANNCIATTDFTVTQPIMQTISIVNIMNPTCIPGCDGSVQVVMSGGTPPYSFSLINGGGAIIDPFTGIMTNLCSPMTYTVMVGDANGCSMSHALYINQPQILNGNLTINNPASCTPGCDGSGVLNILNGVPPYNYSIAPSGTINASGVFSNVCSGNFTISVSDSVNCPSNISFIMPNVMHINATIGIGSITANPANGSPPYEYSLNGGPYTLNNTFTYLCNGFYTLSVKDANIPACIKDTLVQVTASNTQFPGGNVTPIITQPSCNLTNDGSIALNVTPANTYSYLWVGGDTSNPLMNKLPGTYTVNIKNPAGQCVRNTYNLSALGVNCGNIFGQVFLDTNYNCVYNIGEPYVQSKQIKVNPGNHIVYTNANGFYSISGLPYGNYTVSNMNNLFGYYPNCTNNIPVTLNAINNNLTQDFSDSNANVIDYNVYLIFANCFIIPDTLKQRSIGYKFTPFNPIQPQTATIYAKFDSINHFLSSVPAPSFINGDTVFWNVNNVNDSLHTIQVRFTFPLNYTIVNTAPFSYGIINTQYTDNILVNNHYSHVFSFCNAYDPNNKLAIPAGEGPDGEINYYDPHNEELIYTINFQNTGNAPAYNIVVEDTISDKLDINTLEVIHVTHNYLLEVKNGNILRWKFPYIMLPDSTSDFAGSIGTIIYKIKQSPNNQIGDKIENTAYIYFDNNPAIITNTTLHTLADTIVIPNSINEWQSSRMSIYPNPAKNSVHIESNEDIGIVQIYDVHMRLLFQEDFSEKRKAEIPTTTLSNGVYIIKASNRWVHKLVIEK